MSFVIGENDSAPISDKPRTEKKGKSKIPSTSTIVSMMAGVLVFIVLMGSMVIPITVQLVDNSVTDVEETYTVKNDKRPYYTPITPETPLVLEYETYADFLNDFMKKLETREYVTSLLHIAFNSEDKVVVFRYAISGNVATKNVTYTINANPDDKIKLQFYRNSPTHAGSLAISVNDIVQARETGSLYIKDPTSTNTLYDIPKYSKSPTLTSSEQVSYLTYTEGDFMRADNYPATYNIPIETTYELYELPEDYRYADIETDRIYTLTNNSNRWLVLDCEEEISVDVIHTVRGPFKGSDQVKSLILIIPTILIAMFVAYLCKAFMGSGGFSRGKGGAE